MTERKFYKAIFQFVVLSETPFSGNESAADLATSTCDGDDVGQFEMVKSKELNGKQAANELCKLGSEPGFFRLDEKGNDEND